MTIKITPLQNLLRQKIISTAIVRQVCDINRSTYYRWLNGHTFPERPKAEKLIELFGRENLDFNGCYEATIDAADLESNSDA